MVGAHALELTEIRGFVRVILVIFVVQTLVKMVEFALPPLPVSVVPVQEVTLEPGVKMSMNAVLHLTIEIAVTLTATRAAGINVSDEPLKKLNVFHVVMIKYKNVNFIYSSERYCKTNGDFILVNILTIWICFILSFQIMSARRFKQESEIIDGSIV